jgi:predicted RNA-binding protein (TIGR00451 family)
MEELRRTAVGRIGEDGASTMQELADAMFFHRKGDDSLLSKMLKAPEEFIGLPKAYIKESALASVRSGAQIMAPGLEKADEGVAAGQKVAIYCGSRFVGVGVAMVVKIERMHAHGTS